MNHIDKYKHILVGNHPLYHEGPVMRIEGSHLYAAPIRERIQLSIDNGEADYWVIRYHVLSNDESGHSRITSVGGLDGYTVDGLIIRHWALKEAGELNPMIDLPLPQVWRRKQPEVGD